MEPGVVWGAIDEQQRKAETLQALRKRLPDDAYADLNIEVCVGGPGHEIVAFAERLPADLIVMPSHGRTGIQRILIGSVAERVVRLAPCPVLIFRQPKTIAAEG